MRFKHPVFHWLVALFRTDTPVVGLDLLLQTPILVFRYQVPALVADSQVTKAIKLMHEESFLVNVLLAETKKILTNSVTPF